MPVELVELAETWRPSARERLLLQQLVEVFTTALERRLPRDLELVSVDVGVTKRVAAERPQHGEATG